jgi:hypothetical protein
MARSAALALVALLLLAQTPHARKARNKAKKPPPPGAAGAGGPGAGGPAPGGRGGGNPLATPHLEVNVPHEPPKGWREALYADDGAEWVALSGGPRASTTLAVPADPPGHPNELVAFLASNMFLKNYFEQLPTHIVVEASAKRRKRICNIAEGQLLMREFHLGQPRNRADVERPCLDRQAHVCSSGVVGTNNVQFAFGSLDKTRPDGAPSGDWPVRCLGLCLCRLSPVSVTTSGLAHSLPLADW